MSELTEEQIASRRTLRRWLYIGGGVLLFIGVYISAFLIPDVVRSASGPESMTLAEAAAVAGSEQTYARVEGGTWDCDTLVQVIGLSPSHRRYGSPLEEDTKSTEIFYTDDSREVVVFVTLSGEVECADLAGDVPSGYLYAMSSGTRQELTNDARLARYFDSDTFLEFCGYCGRENSMIGAVFGMVFLVGGLGMIVSARRMRPPTP